MSSLRKTILICLFVIIVGSAFSSAASQQRTNVFLLTPYYLDQLTRNGQWTEWHNLTLLFYPSDGAEEVITAIMSFDLNAASNTDVELLVNRGVCDPASYTIDTSQGQYRVSFDCSNIITKPGEYHVQLRASKDVGSVTATSDITYITDPAGGVEVHGTEYKVGEAAKVWLQLLDEDGNSINTAICETHVYYPNGEQLYEEQLMSFLEDGVYEYNFIAPSRLGVYPAIAECYYDANVSSNATSSANIITGTAVGGSHSDTFTSNNVRWSIEEYSVQWQDGFLKRRTLNVTNAGTTTLTNFPMLINITYDSDMQSDYDDLRFYTGTCGSESTELDYEIENYTASRALVWLEIPSFTTGVNNVCMYYGNSSVSSGQDITGTWDANYIGVWHMIENGTATQRKNSKNPALNATPNNYDGDEWTTLIDGADDLDGTNDFLTTSSFGLQTSTSITMEAWINADVTSGRQLITYMGYTGGNGWGLTLPTQHEMHMSIDTNQLSCFYGDDELSAAYVYITTAFTDTTNNHYIACVITSPSVTPSATFYVDGLIVGTDTGTQIGRANWDVPFRIGSPSDTVRRFNGVVDEVRTSGNARSSDWLNQTYKSFVMQSSLVSIGDEENFTSIPDPNERLTAYFNLTNISNYITPTSTELIITLEASWSGQSGDDIYIEYYNYSLGDWVTLPNFLVNTGGSDLTISNSFDITSTNLTNIGLSQNGTSMIRLVDANVSDSTRSTLAIDYLVGQITTLVNGTFHEVKGSSELHVTSYDNLNYNHYTLCGDSQLVRDSSSCSIFMHDYAGYEDLEPQGVIFENITIRNDAHVDLETYVYYETPESVDCTGILEVNYYQNGTPTDLYDDTIFDSGFTTGENCLLSIPITLDSDVYLTNIEILSENYMVWEGYWSNDVVEGLTDEIYTYCNDLASEANYTYEVPLEHDLTDDSISGDLSYCARAVDDIYWLETIYTESVDAETAGDYVAYLQEFRFYVPRITDHHTKVHEEQTEGWLQSIISTIARIYNLLFNPVQMEIVTTQGGENNINLVVRIHKDLDESINETILNASCNLTIQYQNLTYLINNIPMQQYEEELFNYTFTNDGNGPYIASAVCALNDSNGDFKYFHDSATIEIPITPTQIYEGIPELEIVDGDYYGSVVRVVSSLSVGSNEVSNAQCNVTIYNDTMGKVVDDDGMFYIGEGGLYQYNWSSGEAGRYTVRSTCYGGSLGTKTAFTTGGLDVRRDVGAWVSK